MFTRMRVPKIDKSRLQYEIKCLSTGMVGKNYFVAMIIGKQLHASTKSYLDVYDDLASSVIQWPKRVEKLFVQHLLHFSFVKRIKHFPRKQTYRTLRISLKCT